MTDRPGHQPASSPAKPMPPRGGSATAAPPPAVDLDQVEEHVEAVVARAREIRISTQAQYEAAASFLTDELKPALREIDDTFGPIVKAAHLAHQEALTQRRRHEMPLLEAEKIVKGAMTGYSAEQRRIAAEQERQRIAEARRLAEDAAVEEAARLERDGHQEAAQARLEQPVTPVIRTPAPPLPKAAGISEKPIMKFRIVDPSKIGRKFMQPDTKKIRAVVRSMGADAETVVGGIEVYEEATIAARATS